MTVWLLCLVFYLLTAAMKKKIAIKTLIAIIFFGPLALFLNWIISTDDLNRWRARLTFLRICLLIFAVGFYWSFIMVAAIFTNSKALASYYYYLLQAFVAPYVVTLWMFNLADPFVEQISIYSITTSSIFWAALVFWSLRLKANNM